MSNYYYKGVSLNNIYVNDGKSTTDTKFYGYAGIPNSNSNQGSTYSGERPLAFGFTYQGTNLSTYTTANSTTYTSSGNATIPTGCKSIRVISVGGGGGGGGAGGNATGSAYAKIDWGTGGAGGNGGYGSIVYSNSDTNNNISLSNYNSIYVTVGTAGAAGVAGENVIGAATGNYPAPSGNAGGAGKSSYIDLIKSNGEKSSICTANPGNGGNGGNGASVFVDTTNGFVNPKDGTNGNQGTLTSDPYSSSNYPDIGGGEPGNGGYKTLNDKTGTNWNSTPANDGTSGTVQIIWLYD